MSPAPTLRRLLQILTDGVDKIEAVYSDAGETFPALEASSLNTADPAEALRADPAVAAAILNIMAAAAQISATVCNPAVAALNASQAFHVSACLRVASELNVVELLRDAGPQGLHAAAIAAPSNADPALLARILRVLATHHVFLEVAPDVFANNRISSALDKGRTPAALFANRMERLDGNGVTALAEFFSDDVIKSAAHLADTLLDPRAGELPYNRAFGTEEPLYRALQRPEHAYRLKRFGLGMAGTTATEPPDTIFRGYDWGALAPGSVLVDVGGGLGHVALEVAQRHPALRVVVQDLEFQTEDAKKHWAVHFPEHVAAGMVEFQAHDFFDAQPVSNARVFFLRYIVHNWADEPLTKVLRNLRAAAQPSTELVVVEKILYVAAATSAGAEDAVPGAARPTAPAPLLPNWGVGKAELYYYDMAVHNMLGAGERTLGGFVDVLQRGGWKLARVHHCAGSQLSHLVAVPA
ncbi:O-methyltransferase [Mycena belliarum]|uniref:O-methyltransferase n=1 Tax=Mycena belliarum TaxID=1033014 RepID=A0AAD6XMC3_9AGAR|nr:O-methyltransferase [Mycena belliae]